MIHTSKIPYQLSKIRLHIRNELNYCGDMLVLFGLLEHKLRVTLSSFRKNYDQIWSPIYILKNGKGYSSQP